MKLRYQKPLIKVSSFECNQFITESGGGGLPSDPGTPDVGGGESGTEDGGGIVTPAKQSVWD